LSTHETHDLHHEAHRAAPAPRESAGEAPHPLSIEGARYLERVPLTEGLVVERYRLDNGLTVLIAEDHAAPVVSIQIWYHVGSRMERAGKTGICHLFEHLMFGGTETHPSGKFDRLLEEAGAENNAATFLDWTYYHVNAPVEAVDLVLSLEADRLGKLVLDEAAVSREKDVVANERRQRVEDDVDGAVSELLWSEAFARHGYRIPTIGHMADIEGFSTDDCRAFYGTYYAPNNATLVIVGDVRAATVLPAIVRHMGPLTPSTLPIEDAWPEPPQLAEKRLELKKPTPTEKVSMGYRSPALGDFDHAPLSVLSEVLFGGRSSRMYKRLVHELELANDVRAWVGAFRDPSLFDVYLGAREGVTAERLLLEHDALVEAVRREAPSEEEVARAKARLELATLQGLETVGGKAEQVGFFETVLGDPAGVVRRLEAIRRVSRADVLRVARRYLEASARTMVLVRPDGSLSAAAAEGDEGDHEADEGDDEDELDGARDGELGGHDVE
jgi:zinc protease